MSKTPEPSIYEKAFAKSDKTDAILVVQGKKLHVNKALLSIHSDYFNTLFNSEFKEKSMEEIPIKDVKFEDFATVLSLVHPNRIEPTVNNVENLLKLADRFLLPSVKRYFELFIISTDIPAASKLRLTDQFELETLMEHSLKLFNTNSVLSAQTLQKFSDKTKVRLFNRKLALNRGGRDTRIF
ncbi:hypothetical protein CAEBREN_17627 [Caenorhabditis brenneri]|uniref:BTB domain-containing protein n=1 Tax=Caenorhabditis brenneri TaxID=135651 RepID=G0MVV4_CAEBE|nr:hypothetical protein CAEBREN_17627 [Caenorhabditis brenneri]